MNLDLFPVIGRRAPLVWFVERRPPERERAAESYVLQPPLSEPAVTTLMVAAPRSLNSFEKMLREDRAERDDWRRFLSCCRIVLGDRSPDGREIVVWREHVALSFLEALAGEEVADEVRPGTGPALLPVPGGRVPLNEKFLEAIRRNEEFVGRASEGVGGDALFLWAVPQQRHLNVLIVFHDRGEAWNTLLNPFRLPAGVLYDSL